MSTLSPLHFSNRSFNISDYIDLSLCEVSTEDYHQKRELRPEAETNVPKLDGAINHTWPPDAPHSFDESIFESSFHLPALHQRCGVEEVGPILGPSTIPSVSEPVYSPLETSITPGSLQLETYLGPWPSQDAAQQYGKDDYGPRGLFENHEAPRRPLPPSPIPPDFTTSEPAAFNPEQVIGSCNKSTHSSPGTKKRTAARKFPEATRRVLKEWFADHEMYPYATAMECRELSHKTGLSVQQINTFMSNERSRTNAKCKPKIYSAGKNKQCTICLGC
jgi:hypothetical protein